MKRNKNGGIEKHKAILVVRGQIPKGNRLWKGICTGSKIRINKALLATSVNEEMYVDQMDVISAYVQDRIDFSKGIEHF